ncbi:MAG: bifunctional diaminohydroxyphosphoribosylaminopyrimidine deaminase/5-amino-6-(5-phosphoribosylamino)uracil reductase RibD [Deltaproteobacteria bacterium]|nr:bifunctional diaminohydroxyphosphoribosylaminopyrimidine deaminase/5-amino-6-(5-phosphoribosylamino)uracil reductase RibD [Deltaproteobacteria bacterium]
MPNHEEYMRVALSLAAKGLGRTSPNPAVGAVIVKHGLIAGKGFHKKAGRAHAEIAALDSIKKGSAKGGTLYVTLEPCCNYGRTPPCTGAIISSGVKRVVVGTMDPNPKVSGKGLKALASAGVEVITGVLEEECRALNERYNKFITKGLPFVTIKLAVTLDGKAATSTGESRWITGIEARRRVHRMRSMADAVMVGAGSVIKDDPLLTVRHVEGRDPLKVVVDTGFRILLSAKVFSSGRGGVVVITTKDAEKEKIEKAQERGAMVIMVRKQKGKVDLRDALKALAKMNVVSLLVEGGPSLAASLIRQRLADKLVLFISPKLIGGDGLPAIGLLGVRRIDDCPVIKNLRIKRLGQDIMVNGDL